MPTRSKPIFGRQLVETSSGTFSHYNQENTTREIISEFRVTKRITNVRHTKLLQAMNGYQGLAYGRRHTALNWTRGGISLDMLPSEIRRQMDIELYGMLKDPNDDNTFELIPFLADIDGTLAMFTTKFWRSLTYGSYTWGVLPFVSELKSLLNSLQDIFNRASLSGPSCTPINRKRNLSHRKDFYNVSLWPTMSSRAVTSCDTLLRVSGVSIFRPPDLSDAFGKARFLLDELGVHPDLKTAWDVLPLSFVVDYFLPIGQLLESLHPRGWGSYGVTFSGFISARSLVEFSQSHIEGGKQNFNFVPALCRCYERSQYTSFTRPVPPIEWSAPSLKEIFNTVYLTTRLKRLF